MKHLSGFHRVSLFLVLAALAAPAKVYAGDHDLVMQSIETYPSPMEAGCDNRVKPHFSINGDFDYLVPSGGAMISFSHRVGMGAWTPLSELTVTYAPADGPFSLGKGWPDPADFPSVASGFTSANSVLMPIEDGATEVTLRATVHYTDSSIADAVPSDNGIETAVSVVTPPPGTDCTIRPPILNLCRLHPKACDKPICRGGNCGLIIFDPKECPACGRGKIYEATVSLSVNFRLAVYSGNTEIARSTPLGKAKMGGGKTYNQRLEFQSKPGETYTFKVVPAQGQKAAKGKLPAQPDIQIRMIETPAPQGMLNVPINVPVINGKMDAPAIDTTANDPAANGQVMPAANSQVSTPAVIAPNSQVSTPAANAPAVNGQASMPVINVPAVKSQVNIPAVNAPAVRPQVIIR